MLTPPPPPTCLAGSSDLAYRAAIALGNSQTCGSGYVYQLPGKLWRAGGVGGVLPDGFSKKPDLWSFVLAAARYAASALCRPTHSVPISHFLVTVCASYTQRSLNVGRVNTKLQSKLLNTSLLLFLLTWLCCEIATWVLPFPFFFF